MNDKDGSGGEQKLPFKIRGKRIADPKKRPGASTLNVV